MRVFFKFYHLFFAILTTIALVVHLGDSNFQIIDFLSYFTNLSNIFSAGIFWYLALRKIFNYKFTDSLRGASTSYIIINTIGYWLLIANLPDQHIRSWINLTLHAIMPLAVTAEWFIFPRTNKVALGEAIKWLIFPLGYLAFVLIRGGLSGIYPYYFLNSATLGYGQVLINSFGLTAGGLMVAGIVIFLGDRVKFNQD